MLGWSSRMSMSIQFLAFSLSFSQTFIANSSPFYFLTAFRTVQEDPSNFERKTTPNYFFDIVLFCDFHLMYYKISSFKSTPAKLYCFAYYWFHFYIFSIFYMFISNKKSNSCIFCCKVSTTVDYFYRDLGFKEVIGGSENRSDGFTGIRNQQDSSFNRKK